MIFCIHKQRVDFKDGEILLVNIYRVRETCRWKDEGRHRRYLPMMWRHTMHKRFISIFFLKMYLMKLKFRIPFNSHFFLSRMVWDGLISNVCTWYVRVFISFNFHCFLNFQLPSSLFAPETIFQGTSSHLRKNNFYTRCEKKFISIQSQHRQWRNFW